MPQPSDIRCNFSHTVPATESPRFHVIVKPREAEFAVTVRHFFSEFAASTYEDQIEEQGLYRATVESCQDVCLEAWV